MSFDVPKLVRSPGCDAGHDEESRNDRDIKIDILDGYIRSSERFRVIQVFFGVPGSYGNTGEEVYGPYWALGEREREGRGRREEGKGVRPPLLLSLPFH